jgi:hypothetical protein
MIYTAMCQNYLLITSFTIKIENFTCYRFKSVHCIIVARVTRWVPLVGKELLSRLMWGSCCFNISLFVNFLLTIVLFVLRFTTSDYPYLRFTVSGYPFSILDLRFLITLWYLRFTVSGYPFSFLDLRFLVTPLVS